MGFAQVDFYIVDKQTSYVQTSAAAPSLATNPYSFTFEISGKQPGSGISGIVNHSFTTPAGSGVGGYTLVSGDYDSGEDRWKYSQSFATKSGAGSLDEAFLNGTYVLNVGDATNIPFVLDATPSGDLYPITPQVTGMNNGATWSGGQLLIKDTGTTTLNLSDFTSLYSSTASGQVGGHIGAFLYLTSSGSFTSINQEALTFDSDPAFNTFLISGLTAGSTYQLELEFNSIMTADTTSISGATGVAIFTTRLQVNVLAVPEPATYAEIFGVLALAGAMIHRRRRQTA